MKINYDLILKKNMLNVLKDILIEIKKNGLKEGHNLYISIDVNNNKIKMPNWLKQNFPNEITIVIQYEYWNLKINKNSFNITLSFNDVKADLDIPFDSIISFGDTYANFGLKLMNDKNKVKKEPKTKVKNDNIIDFNKFKKN